MKVYISVDMEGVAGIVSLAHSTVGGFDYQRGRRFMTGEAAAAARGALAAGATEIIVSDGHSANGCRNILIEDLPPEAWLLTGDLRPMGQLQCLDATFDALMLVGYHGRHGHSGVLDHTFDSDVIYDIRVNGQAFGEVGLNAAVAGALGVPVALVTGDDRTVAEAREFMPEVPAVAVKTAVGRHAAESLHPLRAQEAIQAAATAGLQTAETLKPLRLNGAVEVEINFKSAGLAARAATIPGVEHRSGSIVGLEAGDILEAYPLIVLAVEHGATGHEGVAARGGAAPR
ncbi:MAG: M55 family metallopeptidase [Thermaerobacterales bacterium]